MNDNQPYDSTPNDSDEYTRAPKPKFFPSTPQEYYDFLKVDIMYEGETEDEYFSRMNILDAVNAKIDAENKALRDKILNPPLINRLITRGGFDPK